LKSGLNIGTARFEKCFLKPFMIFCFPLITYEEINTALSVMKKGKAADVFELTVENILYGGDELFSSSE
jgi:hypothetical protein